MVRRQGAVAHSPRGLLPSTRHPADRQISIDLHRPSEQAECGRHIEAARRERRAGKGPRRFLQKSDHILANRATDGHGKNFSIYLRPGGGFALTPFYDVLSTQPAFDKKQVPNNRYRLAMSVGINRKYTILDIWGRHFVETGREAGFGKSQIKAMIDDVLAKAPNAAEQAFARMPKDFAKDIHESVASAIGARLSRLEHAHRE